VLLESLRFVPFPDAAGALGSMRALGVRTAVVSNWDCSLAGLLGALGIGGLLDKVVTSAEAGSRKPAPGIFEVALEGVYCRPERALLVGDSLDIDIAGGRAAGIRSVLLDRAAASDVEDVERISTLDNLPALLSGSPIV
jgi:putative hydrolase of the HAD superfamily